MSFFYVRKIFITFFLLGATTCWAQNLGVNTSAAIPHTDAILDLNTGNSGTYGFLAPHVYLSNVTSTSPFTAPMDNGLLVYDTNASTTGGNGIGYYYWNGAGTWLYIDNTGSAGSSAWQVIGNTGIAASTSGIGTTANNNFIGTTNAADFVLAANGYERMRIANSTGFIGVGTTSPNNGFDINNSYGVNDTDITPTAPVTVTVTSTMSTINLFASTVPANSVTLKLPAPSFSNIRRIYVINYLGTPGQNQGPAYLTVSSGSFIIPGYGYLTTSINLSLGAITVQSDGSDWTVTSQSPFGGVGGGYIGARTNNPVSCFDINGSYGVNDTDITPTAPVTVTVTSTMSTINLFASTVPANSVTLKLPAPSFSNIRRIYVINYLGTPGQNQAPAYLTLSSGSFIAPGYSYLISSINLSLGAITVQSDGSNWTVTSQSPFGGTGGEYIGVRTPDPLSCFDINGSYGVNDTDITPTAPVTVTVTSTMSTINLFASTVPANSVTLKLPAPSFSNIRRIYVINYLGTPGQNQGPAYLTLSSGSFIAPGYSYLISSINLSLGSITVQSDGTNWTVTSQSPFGGTGGEYIGVRTPDPLSCFDINGSYGVNDTDITPTAPVTVTVTSTMSTINVFASTVTANSITLKLPVASFSNARRIYVINYLGTPGQNDGPLTLKLSSGSFITPGYSYLITSINLSLGTITVQSDGTNWTVTSQSPFGGTGGGYIGVRTPDPLSCFDINGSYGVNDTDISPTAPTTITVTSTMSTINVFASTVAANSVTLKIPVASFSNARRIYVINYLGTPGQNDGPLNLKLSSGSFVAPGYSYLVGSINLTLGSLTLQSDGTNWAITSQSPFGGSGGASIGVRTSDPLSCFDINGSYGVNDTLISSAGSYTLTSTQSTVFLPAPSVPTYTITLPSAANATRRIYKIVYNGVSNGDGYTIKDPSANIIANGVSSTTYPFNDGTVTLQSDGNNWLVSSIPGWLPTGNGGITASTSAIGTAANNNFIGTTNGADFVLASNGYERMRISSGGNIGIGCTAPQYPLHVNGNMGVNGTIYATAASVSAGVLACSDIRYKKDILPLSSALENVLKLQGVNYYWKKNEFPDKHFTDGKQIGFIAQQIEKVYPEVVFTDSLGYKSVDYSRLTPTLVEAIKEQQKIIDSLKSVLQSEKKVIDTLQIKSLAQKNTSQQNNQAFNMRLENDEKEIAELKQMIYRLTKVEANAK